MAAIAAIKSTSLPLTTLVLQTDDAGIGFNKTFSPERTLPNGFARWVDRSGGVPAGFPSFTLGIRNPSQGNRNYKVTATFVVPTLETLGTSSQSGYLPAQKVGYQGVARAEFVMPERMTLAERNTLLSGFLSFFCSQIQASDGTPSDNTGTPLLAAISQLENVY